MAYGAVDAGRVELGSRGSWQERVGKQAANKKKMLVNVGWSKFY